MENLGINLESIYPLVVSYGLKLLLAIVTLLVGFWVINMIMKSIRRNMEKRNVEASLRQFLHSLLSILLKIMLVISVISMVGVEMTSFVAILAAAGLAVGMALSGTLQNFAGGVLIILLKPFKVGDYIEAQGFSGTVNDIQIFNTILKTPDNKTIILPNGALSTSPATNYSAEPTRRVDFTFGIGYSDDIDKAKSVIQAIIDKDSRIMREPSPFIAVSELADSSVNFAVRVWANAGDYWAIHWDMIENVKKQFDKEGISIPFPQRDVHLFNES